MINSIKKIFFVVLFIHSFLYANIIIGDGNVERISSPTIKDINCQNYTIRVGGLLDTSAGGILREVTQLEINGKWDFGTGQIKELGTWINNGTVAVKPTQTGDVPNLEFTTLCGPVSIQGTSDTDGDGISDADEGDNAVALGHGILLDQDEDGIYNFLDEDSDNDGLTDAVEGGNTIDTDGDGIPDYLDNSDSTPNSSNDSSLVGNDIGDDISIDILANDTLNDGSAAIADDVNVTLIAPNGGIVNEDGSVTVPAEGTWTYNSATGILTFHPIDGFIGNPMPISYILTEISTGLASTPSTVHVAYDAVVPVTLNAVDDGTIVITHYGATPIDVLSNDTFEGSVNISIAEQPNHGTFEIVQGSDGHPMVLYSPFANINQVMDSFIYTIINAKGETAQAAVQLDIQCASTQTSDGTAHNRLTLIIMMLMTMLIGIYMMRREYKNI